MTDHNAINYSGSKIIRFGNPLKLCYKFNKLSKVKFHEGQVSWAKLVRANLSIAKSGKQCTVNCGSARSNSKSIFESAVVPLSVTSPWSNLLSRNWHQNEESTHMNHFKTPLCRLESVKLCKTAKIDRSTRTWGRDNRTHA